MITVSIQDEKTAGGILHTLEVELPAARCTVSAIIGARVRAEVSAYNHKFSQPHMLVPPTETELTRNGHKTMCEPKKLDIEQQIYIALDAFQKNGFCVLVDNIQTESLDQIVQVSDNTLVSFLRLTPLVGG